MCWFEKQWPNCPICGSVGVPEVQYLGCPFEQPLGECNLVFEASANTSRPHPTCVQIDQIAREVALGMTRESHPAPTYIDALDGVDPYESPLPSPFLRSAPIVDPGAALPAAWTSSSSNNPSHAMTIATNRRNELHSMMLEFASTLSDLENTIAPLNPQFALVVEWIPTHMTAILTAANIYIDRVTTFEWEVANGTGIPGNASFQIRAIVDGITNSLAFYESAPIWSRRYTDLITHFRRLAGQLSPPQPAANDLPPVMPERRGASAGLETDDLDGPSDSLPPATLFLPDDAFNSDNEMEAALDDDEQFAGDDEEFDDSHYP